MHRSHISRRSSSMPRYAIPEAGFRERQYKRPLLNRLRPFSWFLIALVVMALIGVVVVVLYRQAQRHEETVLLSDRLAPTISAQAGSIPAKSMATIAVPAAIITSTLITPTPVLTQVIVQPQTIQTITAAISATINATITPPPTTDSTDAPWRNQLVRQPDGTLQAPEEVQARARKELGEYYRLLRDLPLADYLKQRDTILNTYFTGPARDGMLKLETDRKQYLMNRAGTVSIEVRDFSANGLAATVGIRASGWVNDVYDAATGNLITKSRIEKATFSVVRITFIRVSDRWKFAIVKQVTEVSRP